MAERATCVQCGLLQRLGAGESIGRRADPRGEWHVLRFGGVGWEMRYGDSPEGLLGALLARPNQGEAGEWCERCALLRRMVDGQSLLYGPEPKGDWHLLWFSDGEWQSRQSDSPESLLPAPQASEAAL